MHIWYGMHGIVAQVQTPNYPTGDGSCDKPCDCGVPCGRYLWDTRNPDLVDWLVNVHLTGNTMTLTLTLNSRDASHTLKHITDPTFYPNLS